MCMPAAMCTLCGWVPCMSGGGVWLSGGGVWQVAPEQSPLVIEGVLLCLLMLNIGLPSGTVLQGAG